MSKHRDDNWKYDAERGIFDGLWSNNVLNVGYSSSVETKTKKKTMD